MLSNIDNLKPLRAEELARVRDIYLPLTAQDAHGARGLCLESAVAYLGAPVARRLYDPARGSMMPELMDVAGKLDIALRQGLTRFRIEAGSLAYRAQIGQHTAGADVHLRVLPAAVPLLDELHMDPLWRALMLHDSLLAGGLVLIAAPHGQGKTTTASSMVASRLHRFGGMASTVEYPAELPLQGCWGTGGLCIQREIGVGQDRDSISATMIDSLRQYPAMGESTILLIGEIVDPESAAEAVLAAANGHLVIATMHGRGIETALRRLVLLCCTHLKGMEEASVRGLLAEVLRGIFHQRLAWTLEGTGWSAANVEGQVAWSADPESALAEAIRNADRAALNVELRAQQAVADTDPEGYLRAYTGQEA